MTKRGRKPKPGQEPKLAFDYRRYITIVQVLSLDKSEGLKLTDLQVLARHWEVNPHGSFEVLLQRLAKHAVDYHREETTQ